MTRPQQGLVRTIEVQSGSLPHLIALKPRLRSVVINSCAKSKFDFVVVALEKLIESPDTIMFHIKVGKKLSFKKLVSFILAEITQMFTPRLSSDYGTPYIYICVWKEIASTLGVSSDTRRERRLPATHLMYPLSDYRTVNRVLADRSETAYFAPHLRRRLHHQPLCPFAPPPFLPLSELLLHLRISVWFGKRRLWWRRRRWQAERIIDVVYKHTAQPTNILGARTTRLRAKARFL